MEYVHIRTEAPLGETRLDHLSANLGEKDIEKVVEQLEKHSMTALGENGSITLERSKEILISRP